MIEAEKVKRENATPHEQKLDFTIAKTTVKDSEIQTRGLQKSLLMVQHERAKSQMSTMEWSITFVILFNNFELSLYYTSFMIRSYTFVCLEKNPRQQNSIVGNQSHLSQTANFDPIFCSDIKISVWFFQWSRNVNRKLNFSRLTPVYFWHFTQ